MTEQSPANDHREGADRPGSAHPPLIEVDVTAEPVETADVAPKIKPPVMTHQLRRLTLYFLVGVVVLALAIMAAGLALHWFDTDFAKTILQTVVSPLLGALAAVVGYLFAERKE